MTVTIEEFTKGFAPKRLKNIDDKVQVFIEEELTLRDLRQAHNFTQETIAEILGVEQENVSRLERRADVLLSTLSSYVAAMGGKLRLIAEFPDRNPVAVSLADITQSEVFKPKNRKKIKPA